MGYREWARRALFGAIVCSASPTAHADPDPVQNEEREALSAAPAPRSNDLRSEFPLRGDDSIPPGFHLESRIRKAPFIAGLAVGGAGYVLGGVAASIDGFDNQKGWLLIPVAGPWITLGRRDDSCPKDSAGNCCTEPGCPGSFADVFLVLDGLMQATGAALVTFAVASPRRWAVRDVTTSLVILPRFQPGGFGLSLSGTL